MPWKFSLFHCSSPYGGGALPPVLPNGVRTFLNQKDCDRPQNQKRRFNTPHYKTQRERFIFSEFMVT